MAATVQSHSITNIANTVTSLVITKPSGTVDGELMVAALAYNGSSNPFTPPAGWTLISDSNSASTSPKGLVTYYRIASSEGANYTWTLSSNTVGGAILRISGIQDTPIGASSASTSGSSTTSSPSPTPSGITPTQTNQLLLAFTVAYQDGASTFTSTAGYTVATDDPTWTEQYDDNFNMGVGKFSQAMAWALRSQSTATGALSFTTNVAVDRYATQLIAITRFDSQTFTETVTCTDSGTNNNIGFNLTTSDTVTTTDITVAEKTRLWVEQNKSSSTWTDQDIT